MGFIKNEKKRIVCNQAEIIIIGGNAAQEKSYPFLIG